VNPQLRVVRWWVGTYTSGLDPVVRDRRRAEIDSDLWEQVDAHRRAGRSSAAITVAIWRRSLSGVIDDVFWRREQPRGTRAAPATTEGSTAMFGSTTRGSMLVPIGVVGVAILGAITLQVIGEIQHNEQSTVSCRTMP
jgi:hypothetical protein